MNAPLVVLIFETFAIVLVVTSSIALIFRATRLLHFVPPVKPLDGARADRFNAWRFPTEAEIAAGADKWDLVFLGSTVHPEDAREMLPEQGGQVQEGLTGAVVSYVNPDHELAKQQRQIARDRAARSGGDAA